MNLIDEFLLSEKAAGKAPGTLRNRKWNLRALERRLDRPIEQATRADLLASVVSLSERVTPENVNVHIASYRLFYRWLQEEELRDDNPAQRLKFVPTPIKPVEALSPTEVSKLIEYATKAAPKRRFGTYRTAVMALVMLDVGLRVGEVVRLDVGDIDFESGLILIRKTKTGRPRHVPLSLELRGVLRRYLVRRQKRLERLGRDGPAFCVTEAGRRCSVDAIEAAFRALGKEAGIESRLYPHLLRHTFATQSLLNGAPLPAVMATGGWRRLSTVQRYTFMSTAMLQEVHERTSPLRRSER